MRQRPQYLLEAWARAGHPVYFVDPREDRARSVDGVTIVPTIRQTPRSGVILHIHFAPLRHLIERFDDAVVVYDLLDDLSIYDADEIGVPEGGRVRSHHPVLMGIADVVTTSNEVLAEKHRRERADLLLVSNGVDLQAFSQPWPTPSDLPTTRPLIGYHGMVSSWFDFDLLEAVAGLRPDWTFALVGPVDARVDGRVRRLQRLPNVAVLGERPSDAMPAYVQAFDVGAVWFRVNDLTLGVTPLKMYECLAADRPCVATPLPGAVAEEAVTVAGTAADFVAAIETSLRTRHDPASATGRREAAEAADWSRRLEPVLERLGGRLYVP